MNRLRKNRRSGQTLIEFTLVGIPLIFVLISIFEISRGMWVYHTMAYAVRNGVRYAAVHGINCVGKSVNALLDNPNACTVNMGPADTAGTVAYVIRQAAIGLDPAKTTVIFSAGGVASPSCTLDVGSCPATIWPPYDSTSATTYDYVGRPIKITISTPFLSALAMLWPSSGPVKFASGTLAASSQDYIQF